MVGIKLVLPVKGEIQGLMCLCAFLDNFYVNTGAILSLIFRGSNSFPPL